MCAFGRQKTNKNFMSMNFMSRIFFSINLLEISMKKISIGDDKKNVCKYQHPFEFWFYTRVLSLPISLFVFIFSLFLSLFPFWDFFFICPSLFLSFSRYSSFYTSLHLSLSPARFLFHSLAQSLSYSLPSSLSFFLPLFLFLFLSLSLSLFFSLFLSFSLSIFTIRLKWNCKRKLYDIMLGISYDFQFFCN